MRTDEQPIIVDDDNLTFYLLCGLLMGNPVQRMLLGPNALGEQTARDVYVEAAWHLFIGGLQL